MDKCPPPPRPPIGPPPLMSFTNFLQSAVPPPPVPPPPVPPRPIVLDPFVGLPHRQTVTQKVCSPQKDQAIHFQCKSCSAKFPTLQICLAHELVHVVNQPPNQSKSTNCEENDIFKFGKKRKRKQKMVTLTEETKEEIEFQKKVISCFSKPTDELYMMKTFSILFQPEPVSFKHIYCRIHNDLKAELNKHSVHWIIKPFGSIINSLMLKTSDIDFFITIASKREQDYIVPPSVSQAVKKHLIYSIRNCLQRGSSFTSVIAVANARVPVIKCTHKATNYNLDISFTSRNGVYNSRFICNVLNFNNKVHSVLLIIKVWAKRYELTKTGRLTNYCLTLLVFFYLQNCVPPVIPTVKKLQENCEPLIIEGFNYAFNHSLKWPRVGKTIFELVRGFFQFYAKFDFEQFIICPYLGQKIQKSYFQEKQVNFPEYEKQVEMLKALNLKNTKFKPTATNANLSNDEETQNDSKPIELKLTGLMVVQDPFCLTLNKFNPGPNVFTHFRNCIERAAEITSDSSKLMRLGQYLIYLFYGCSDDVERGSGTDTDIIKTSNNSKTETVSTPIKNDVTSKTVEKEPINSLQFVKPSEPPKVFQPASSKLLESIIKPCNNSEKVPDIDIKTNGKFIPLEVEMTHLRRYLLCINPGKPIKANEIRKIWCEKMFLFIRDILENIFRITVKEQITSNLQKSPKIKGQTDVHTNNMIKKYNISSSLDLWTCRKQGRAKKGNIDFLNNILKTTKLLANERHTNTQFLTHLNSVLKLEISDNFLDIKIELINIAGKAGKSAAKLLFNEINGNIRNIIIAKFEQLYLDAANSSINTNIEDSEQDEKLKYQRAREKLNEIFLKKHDDKPTSRKVNQITSTNVGSNQIENTIQNQVYKKNIFSTTKSDFRKDNKSQTLFQKGENASDMDTDEIMPALQNIGVTREINMETEDMANEDNDEGDIVFGWLKNTKKKV